MRVLAVVVVAVALVTSGLGATPASAKRKPPPNPCTVLLPADLETIFEQPWVKGKEQIGGACTLRRPNGVKVPDIVVSLIIEQKASPRKAKKAFERGLVATEDIVPQIETIKGMGNEAYFTTIIGAEVLTFRVGRRIAELRVDRIDRPEETYRDQTIAAGEIVEARLTPVKKKAK
jgi:hypothetical protein